MMTAQVSYNKLICGSPVTHTLSCSSAPFTNGVLPSPNNPKLISESQLVNSEFNNLGNQQLQWFCCKTQYLLSFSLLLCLRFRFLLLHQLIAEVLVCWQGRLCCWRKDLGSSTFALQTCDLCYLHLCTLMSDLNARRLIELLLISVTLKA